DYGLLTTEKQTPNTPNRPSPRVFAGSRATPTPHPSILNSQRTVFGRLLPTRHRLSHSFRARLRCSCPPVARERQPLRGYPAAEATPLSLLSACCPANRSRTKSNRH